MTMPRHLAVLQQLLPSDGYDVSGPELVVELTALAQQLDDLQDNGDQLLLVIEPEKFPALLGLWEEAYGLPDRCDTVFTPSIEARFAALRAKRRAQADFSIPYLTDYAEKLGYAGTTITNNRMATCADPCDRGLYGERHRALVDVHVPAVRPQRTATCADPCFGPLRQYDDMRIECAFRAIELAHVLFRFFYGEE